MFSFNIRINEVNSTPKMLNG